MSPPILGRLPKMTCSVILTRLEEMNDPYFIAYEKRIRKEERRKKKEKSNSGSGSKDSLSSSSHSRSHSTATEAPTLLLLSDALTGENRQDSAKKKRSGTRDNEHLPPPSKKQNSGSRSLDDVKKTKSSYKNDSKKSSKDEGKISSKDDKTSSKDDRKSSKNYKKSSKDDKKSSNADKSDAVAVSSPDPRNSSKDDGKIIKISKSDRKSSKYKNVKQQSKNNSSQDVKKSSKDDNRHKTVSNPDSRNLSNSTKHDNSKISNREHNVSKNNIVEKHNNNNDKKATNNNCKENPAALKTYDLCGQLFDSTFDRSKTVMKNVKSTKSKEVSKSEQRKRLIRECYKRRCRVKLRRLTKGDLFKPTITTTQKILAKSDLSKPTTTIPVVVKQNIAVVKPLVHASCDDNQLKNPRKLFIDGKRYHFKILPPQQTKTESPDKSDEEYKFTYPEQPVNNYDYEDPPIQFQIKKRKNNNKRVRFNDDVRIITYDREYDLPLEKNKADENVELPKKATLGLKDYLNSKKKDQSHTNTSFEETPIINNSDTSETAVIDDWDIETGILTLQAEAVVRSVLLEMLNNLVLPPSTKDLLHLRPAMPTDKNANISSPILPTIPETKWYCPICARFDSCNGVVNEVQVKRHIVRRHGEAIMDINLESHLNKANGSFKCNDNCDATFPEQHGLIFHLAFEHNLLIPRVLDLKLDSTNYIPMPFDRQGKEIRYKCLRCSTFRCANKSDLMLHLSLVHYIDSLLPCGMLRDQHRNLGYFHCTQLRCEKRFNSLPGLAVHEQQAHNALEIYFGKFIGEKNDLYEEAGGRERGQRVCWPP